MARKTLKQKKAAIKTWRAKFNGPCWRCNHTFDAGTLVCRDPLNNRVIHYVCHPDWVPAPLPGFTHAGRRIPDAK